MRAGRSFLLYFPLPGPARHRGPVRHGEERRERAGGAASGVFAGVEVAARMEVMAAVGSEGRARAGEVARAGWRVTCR